MGESSGNAQQMVEMETLKETKELHKSACRVVTGSEAAVEHVSLTAANTGDGTETMAALAVDIAASGAAEFPRWILGGKNGKIVGEFPAKMLWTNATSHHVVRIKGNTADIIFERGAWTSLWSRGSKFGMEMGRYTSGTGGRRFSRTAAKEMEEIGVSLDCPLRVQVGLTEDYGKVSLTLMCLPCAWGEATTKYTGFVGEAPR